MFELSYAMLLSSLKLSFLQAITYSVPHLLGT